MADTPDFDELGLALLDESQPTFIAGDTDAFVAVTANTEGHGFVRLLVVHPGRRGQGVGTAMLNLAEKALIGCPSVSVGTDAPFYLFPGVDTRCFPMMCLAEKHRFRRTAVNFNLMLDRQRLPPIDTSGVFRATDGDATEVMEFVERYWPRYAYEVPHALRKGNVFLRRDDTGISGFCAHSITRKSWIGPVAIRPDLIGHGYGEALTAAVANDLWENHPGRSVIVEWVDPFRPYARLGATLAATYVVYRKEPGRMTNTDQPGRSCERK